MESNFFKNNRIKLMELVGCDLIVLTAYGEMQRSSDSAWRFEQEANFWYLTGISSPGWLCLIIKGETILVSPAISESSKIFNGSLRVDRALELSGADRVIGFSEGRTLLNELSKKYRTVCTIKPNLGQNYDFALNPAQDILQEALKDRFAEVKSIGKDILRLRSIKQKPEIMMLRRAINLTKVAFNQIKQNLSDYDFEYQIQADFSHIFQRTNADHAYDPIVASGHNALTLHYCSNGSPLRKDDMILIDVGARYGHYSADITRTYFNGKDINKRQRDVHDAVRIAKDRIVNLIKPKMSIRDYITDSDKIMREALISIGLEEGDNFRKYFPHAVSHGLGIETHDTLGGFESFMPGMVLTVEPGIYIPEESIGVRIEDDILVTDLGTENLSGSLSDSF